LALDSYTQLCELILQNSVKFSVSYY